MIKISKSLIRIIFFALTFPWRVFALVVGVLGLTEAWARDDTRQMREARELMRNAVSMCPWEQTNDNGIR